MFWSQNNIGEMRTFSQFRSPANLLRRDLELPEAVAMRLTTQEKPQIAGSLSEASFRSARGMKSSDFWSG